MEHMLFFEIALVIVTAGLIAFLLRFLKQPMIIAYIITGLIVGPGILGLTRSPEVFEAFSSIGVAFLLFLVGLHLNWRNIKDVGKIAVLAGLAQVIFTSLVGYLILFQLGFDQMTSLVASIAFAFSSTIIIVKILSDKEDLDRFYGRISIGILIVQDLVAMAILLVVAAMGAGEGDLGLVLGVSLVKLAVVIMILWALAKYTLPHIFRYAARSQELLFLVALSWCFALASGLTFLGFSIEAGALLAGISLAGSQFHRESESKIRPLRDFFLILFFIVLGTQLTLSSFSAAIGPAVIVSAFILIGNPLILLAALRLFGYHPRTGFLVGVTMAQVSEFSFILLAGALAVGSIDESILPVATLVAMITIAISTYLIKYNEAIYEKLEFLFRWMDSVPEQKDKRGEPGPSVILFGLHNMGEAILPSVKSMKEDYLVVDFNPVVIDKLARTRIPHMYGDMGSRDFLQHVQAEKAKLIISTIPDMSANTDLIEYLKMRRSRAAVVVTARNDDEALKMYEAGASFVIVPTIMGGEHFGHMLDGKKLSKSSWMKMAKRQKQAFLR